MTIKIGDAILTHATLFVKSEKETTQAMQDMANKGYELVDSSPTEGYDSMGERVKGRLLEFKIVID